MLKVTISGSAAARKGIFIGVVLVAVNQLSGLFSFLNYTADVFVEAGSSFSPNTSAVIVGVLLCCGSLVSVNIIDRFTRRFLYSLSTAGNIVGLLSMGIYSYCKANGDVTGFQFVPLASLSLVIFASSAARLPLTYVIMAEIMPQNIRSFGVSVCTTVNWILCFLMLRFFSTAVEILHFHNFMFIFSAVTTFGIIFVLSYVPETKNRSFEEIEKALTSKKFDYKPTGTSENDKA